MYGEDPYNDPYNQPLPPPPPSSAAGTVSGTVGNSYLLNLNGGAGGVGTGAGEGNGLSDRPVFDFPELPGWKPPEFVAPTFDDAKNEAGYQFRLDSGQQALERSAAARGVLRTGGTLKDALEYGQNFASAEYDKVFNRSTQTYDRDYRRSYDMYQPLLQDYNNRFGAELKSGLAAYDRDWQTYVFNHSGGGGAGNSAYEEWLRNQPPL